MKVPAFPALALHDLLPAHKWPFDQIPEDSALFFRGAGAILQAARMIGLTDEDEVLVPAYHCGIEVEAIRHTGARIVFVPLTPNLAFTPDALRARVSRHTKAVLLIHFFGFPQPVKEVRTFCDELGLVLIEDCAHALFSRAGANLLGQTGDFSIFSFQKTLPVPDGGALVGRGVSSNRSAVAPPPFLTTARGITLRLLSSSGSYGRGWEALARWAIIVPARTAARLIKRWRGAHVVTSPSAAELDPVTACLGMSAAAQRIAQHADPDPIIAARRRRYQLLAAALEGIAGIEIPLPDLPDGTCPLFLPLLVRERDSLRAFLETRGIETFVFGEIPHPLLNADTCAISNGWSRENLCLPTHQSLTDDMVSAMIGAVKDWSAPPNPPSS
jgi:dTDP-4-amino-4,6-dideoxygalactose transaminase